jgi:hypothetical protein
MISRRLSRSFIAAAILATLLVVPSAVPAQEKKPSAKVEHWSFAPIERPKLPAVKDKSWIQTPIDAFVLAELEKNGLKPAPKAERRTLLRRVYFDLIGLPPTPEEIEKFLADKAPDAYRKVVENLLARPQYGERWARHWLDVVRYAESNGYERDGVRPLAWRYRDYVINAFNQDKPYDRFVMEQLAGDELPGSSAETMIATTFLRLGTWDDEPADEKVDRYDQLDDVLGTTATAFLGLTLRCARCHDHKFEPFTQKDYYRMLAVFEPLKRPQKGRTELNPFVGSEAELTAYYQASAKIDAEVSVIQKQVDTLKATIRERVLSAKGSPFPPEVSAAFRMERAKQTSEQKALVKKWLPRLEQEMKAAATSDEKAKFASWEAALAKVNAARPKEPPLRAYIWSEDGPQAPVTHILKRGNPYSVGEAVEPGLPTVLVSKQPSPPRATARTTGRRLWLARWLTDPANPLTARVMVNRVWQRHFGEGLVSSANDFGIMGEPPTHPELLDWLASEFIASGWKMKPLHRLIVLSNTYQMGNRFEVRAAKIDPKARLLWRWRQRRLEAEAVRDAVLAVSGQLNPQMAGPSMYPSIPRAVLEGQSRPGDGWGKSDERQAARRSIYIFVKRVLAVPELDLLDAPDTACSCEQRMISTTAPQALTFLNGEFMQQQAKHFAQRLLREAGKDTKSQVERAFVLALGRAARPQERQACLEFLDLQQKQIVDDARRLKRYPGDPERRALEAFCLVLLNTNEFVYVD